VGEETEKLTKIVCLRFLFTCCVVSEIQVFLQAPLEENGVSYHIEEHLLFARVLRLIIKLLFPPVVPALLLYCPSLVLGWLPRIFWSSLNLEQNLAYLLRVKSLCDKLNQLL
jgi:hypothetical protein